MGVAVADAARTNATISNCASCRGLDTKLQLVALRSSMNLAE